MIAGEFDRKAREYAATKSLLTGLRDSTHDLMDATTCPRLGISSRATR